MKNKKWDFLLYIHAVLLVWFLLFLCSLFIPDGGHLASTLAIGNALFLFVNIPLAVFSFILKAKDRFSIDREDTIVVLSVLNSLVSITEWIFVIWLSQSPKFGG